MQKIIVLGSTGSVGKSSLEVIEQNKKYVAKCLVASKNSNLINQQSKVHKQAKIYLENPKTKNSLSKPLIKKEKLYDLISSSQTDTVIAAISGSSGLELIHHSIKSGKKY